MAFSQRFANAAKRFRSAIMPGKFLPLWLHVIVMIAGAVAILVGLWWLFTSEETSPLAHARDDTTTLEVIRLCFYAVAGIGGVVALTVAYRRQRQGENADQREDTKLFNERFATAAEKLSSERAANRLAGVYSMAELADDWDRGRQMCINVLCAYIRMPYEPPEAVERELSEALREAARREDSSAGGLQLKVVSRGGSEPYSLELIEQKLAHTRAVAAIREEQQVRRAVMDVIGERLRSEPVDGRTWHECRFDFSGATIDGGSLWGSVFKAEVMFENATFPSGTLSFSGASFLNGVEFDGAVVSGGMLGFNNVTFAGDETSFTRMTITDGALLFAGAEFTSDFTTFYATKFAGGTVNIAGDDTKFLGETVFFRDASFSGADVSFEGASFGEAEVDFSEVSDWSHPPRFYHPEGQPPRLLLPENIDDLQENEQDAGAGSSGASQEAEAKESLAPN